MATSDVDEQWAPEQTFRAEMRKLREAQELTQTDLSRRLRDAGMPAHQSTVAKIETGERPVRLDEAYLIARVLGSSIERMASARSVHFLSLQKVSDRAEQAYREISQAAYEFESACHALTNMLQIATEGGRIDQLEAGEFRQALANTPEGAVQQGRARFEAELRERAGA